MRSIHAFLKLQADLEALELSFHGERPPLPGSSVLPVDTRNPKLPAAAAAAAATACSSSAGQGSCSDSGGGIGGGIGSGSGGGGSGGEANGTCSSSWSLPCVLVDTEGNSYFSDKAVALGAGTGAGIGALSELIPTTGAWSTVLRSICVLYSGV